MRIAMVFDGLQTGGIERVGVDYMRLLCGMGHDVTVINLKPDLTTMESEVPEQCGVLHVNFPRELCPERYSKLCKRNFLCKVMYPILYAVFSCLVLGYKLLLKCRQSFRREYDVVIAFSGHYNDLTFVASGFLRANKKICWLHGALYGYALIADGFLNLYNKIYNLVVLSDAFQDEVLLTNKQLNLNIKKLYNPSYVGTREIDVKKVKNLKEKYGRYTLMVGRLDKQKDQLTLIKAIEYIHDEYGFSEKLVLVGDGHKRQELEMYVHEHSLENIVYFEGNQFDVQNYYAAAHLFAHSSPLEGLPTTLIEALYFELPIVATDSLPGVREILGNDQFGRIVPVSDYRQLGEAIYNMYSNCDAYNHYVEKSHKRFADFSPDKIRDNLALIIK